MPQMAPINWLSLFISFSLIFIMFNIMNYFFMNSTSPKSNLIYKLNMMNSLNWKW
nr:ATP synthase F0 subunit 8 [Siphona sp. 1 HNL-2023a]